jgi:hypothetical protein
MATNPYSYLFYRIYMGKIQHEEKSLSLFVALMFTALVLNFNLFILAAAFAEWVCNNGFLLPMSRSRIMQIGVASTALISVMLYYYWIRSGRYERVFSKYGVESSNQRRLRTVLMVAHIVVTFASIIVIPVLIYDRANGAG